MRHQECIYMLQAPNQSEMFIPSADGLVDLSRVFAGSGTKPLMVEAVLVIRAVLAVVSLFLYSLVKHSRQFS